MAINLLDMDMIYRFFFRKDIGNLANKFFSNLVKDQKRDTS